MKSTPPKGPAPKRTVGRTGRSASSVDVAREAGVSQSAVSRTFSPKGQVSAVTRAKVKAAAERLGYIPNALATSIITKRSRIIALVVGDIDNHIYSKVVNAFSLQFQERGYHVLLFSLKADAEASRAIPELLMYRVDGVLLVSTMLTQALADACERQGVPVVLFNRYSRHAGVSSVRLDNVAGGALVGDHLVASGRRRIAFVTGSDIDETSKDRERGLTDSLAHHGLQLAARVEGDYNFASGERAMAQLWQRSPHPDAVFLAGDMMAFGAVSYARVVLGLRIPRDISVVGFDDLLPAEWPLVDLTTVRQPIIDMARAAVELLLEKMETTGRRARTILIPGDLIIRGSAPLP